MPTARKNQVDLNISKFFHCVSRCVRKAFIFGNDPETGKNFDHRKAWLVDLIKKLPSIFAIEVCAYAIMSNHYHLVLRINQDKANSWSDREVIKRWAGLFSGSKAKRLLDANLSCRELENHQTDIDLWRNQLFDISWFMKVINERVARAANKEDGCKGKFWESRFRSQALLDESAILTCMTYVDLNPVRAGIAKTPEESEFTSIRDRIRSYKKRVQPQELAPLDSGGSINPLPIQLEEYFRLVDESGRIIREGKSGSIPDHLLPILERLDISAGNWISTLKNFGSIFETFIGTPKSLKKFRSTRGHHRMRGLVQSETSFLSAA